MTAETLTAKSQIKRPGLSTKGSAYYYQSHDADIVDYNIWRLWTPDTGFAMRGPKPASLAPGQYHAALGAAYTFGRFAPRPYPILLGKSLGLNTLNLGFAGVGPIFFNLPRNRPLIELINRAKFATISVMSGRSQSNSRFQAEAHSQVEYRLSNGEIIPADYAYQQLLEEADEATVSALVTETREKYVEEFIQLLESITVPKVLLWFSKRSPDYTESYENTYKLFGSFPHLVNRSMVETLIEHCDAYVECITTAGMPQPLVSRKTGKPVSIARPRTYKNGRVSLKPSTLSTNSYYPSPEMHYDIAHKMLPVCKQFLD